VAERGSARHLLPVVALVLHGRPRQHLTLLVHVVTHACEGGVIRLGANVPLRQPGYGEHLLE